MPHFNAPLSRRHFLKAAPLLAALAADADAAQAKSARTDFPYVDGLCLNVFEKPQEIRASGLSALIADVSAGEMVAEADGRQRYRRTFAACWRSVVAARQKARKVGDVFLAADGREVGAAHRQNKTAVFMQIQGGGEAVGEDLTRIDLFHELGLRVLQITHHHDNALGGGGIEPRWTGLTKLGFEAVARMNALGVIPDLSHSSDLTALDVLKASRRPVIVSHGAARALVNNARCTPDEVIRGVAARGGVMGIFMMSFWLTTDPVPTVESLLRQIRHVVRVGGVDAVGISNDFPVAGEQSLIAAKNNNGEAVKSYLPWWDSVAKAGVLGFDRRPAHVAIPELNNLARMHTIRAALDRGGFKAREVEKIMGGNWIRVLSESV